MKYFRIFLIALLVTFFSFNSLAYANDSNDYGVKIIGFGVSHTRKLIFNSVDTFPAKTGARFGIKFMLEGEESDDTVPVSIKIVHPEQTDPESGIIYTVRNKRFFCKTGQDYTTHISFDEPWEAVAGEYTFELYINSKKMASKTFTVTPKIE